MKITAFAAVRPKTNLVPNGNYALTKEQRRGGFIGVFNKVYPGDARRTLLKIALGAIMDTSTISLAPAPAAKTPEEKQDAAGRSKSLKEWESIRRDRHLEQFTSLKKVNGEDAHFLLSLPIFYANGAASLEYVYRLFSPVPPTDDALREFESVLTSDGDHRFPANLCLVRSYLSENVTNLFSQSLVGANYQVASGNTVVFLEFKISKAEAESLVSTDWIEIRPVDLYPLVSMWAEAEFVKIKYGKSAISLSKIASTLPPHIEGDERIDKFNIAIDMSGDPLWIPKECDNTAKYESMFTSAGTREDGFALRTINKDVEPQLPISIPILVDWVNNKFVYSSKTGKPVILPLEHLRKCNASMAMNLLTKPAADKYANNLKFYADALGLDSSVTAEGLFADQDSEEAADVKRVFGTSTSLPVDVFASRALLVKGQSQKDFALRYLDFTPDAELIFQPFFPFVKRLHQAMLENLEALFVKYAVSTLIEALGMLSVIVGYGSDISNTRAESNTVNKVYANQALDPDWAPPPAPMLTKNFEKETGGLLPHQARVRNMLRDSPDFAMLSVQAGGGKSMLSITDILYEIQANRSAPYLIMCPSHLVANYVSEIVEFTDGKINVIPVTSYNIGVTGITRYEEILDKAPINTIIVVDYGVLKFQGRAAVYGTSAITVYPVVEMLRKFKPGYVMLDESHFLKNAGSARFKTTMSLIADIPKKRLASGTINPDSPSDLPGQVAILDPTIFGTRDNFNQTYGETVNGGRVMQWRTSGANSISTVMSKLTSNVVWASAKRKEWACALPPRSDFFVPTNLTDNQRKVYNAIFSDMVNSIRKKAETDANAKNILDSLENKPKDKKKASKKDEEDFGDLAEVPNDDEDDDEEESDIGPSLQPYLAAIEQFVTSPSSHPYAKNGFITDKGEHVPPLQGDDLLSPKARALQGIMLKTHDVMNPNSGKVLVFVNYNQSVDALFNSMPPEIQACGIRYDTNNKVELVNKFQNDPKIRWMVGIRTSLEVGLNLQVANCLIRVEGVWTPGEQEQGDSRIERPYFGPGGDSRMSKGLQFYTIVANQTIDITKAARLRAKMIALAKFNNPGNPNYEAIEDIPIIPMTLDAIQHQNDFGTNLFKYESSMSELNRVMKEENEEYKVKLEAEGGFKFTQIKQAANPPSAAMLARVPYAQGTQLYKASELGLIRADNYLGMDLTGTEDEEVPPEDEAESLSNKAAKDILRKRIFGLRCHTEFGDGIIDGGNGPGATLNYVKVNMDDGTNAWVHATGAFIITREETNGIDMRNKIAVASGMNVTAPITVPGLVVKTTRITKRELQEQERQREVEERQKKALFDKKRVKEKISVELELKLVNGYMQVAYVVGNNQKAARALEALGFKMDKQYYFTRIKTYKHLITQAKNWASAGFETGNTVDNDTFEALAAEFAGGGIRTHKHYAKLMNSGNFNNYLRQEWKPTADKKQLNLFALVTDGGDKDPGNIKEAEREGVDPNYGVAYLCLPYGAGHPGSKLAIGAKYKAPSTRWMISNPTISKFVGSIQGVHKVLTDLSEAGITVSNISDLNKDARSVKKVAPKIDDTVFVSKDEVAQPKKVVKRAVEPAPTKRTKAVPPAPTKRTKAVEPAPTKRVKAVPPAPTRRVKAVPPPAPKKPVAPAKKPVAPLKRKVVPKR